MIIKIISNGKEYDVEGYKGELISDILKRSDIDINMPCGGYGNCGKCKIKIIEGQCEISQREKNILSEKEINEGVRLACCSYIDKAVIIEIDENNEYKILNDYIEAENEKFENIEFGYAIGIDIGTTTICLKMINMKTGDTVAEESILNGQKVYGADVIARINEAINGKGEKLKNIIKSNLRDGIIRISEKIDKSLINKIIITGNTTMLYLLLGMNCKGLSMYPFENAIMKTIKMDYRELFGNEDFFCDIIIIPCISAFVGGDIVCGGVFCKMDKVEKNALLIDIGTNGEILLKAQGKIYCTSAAAGPAFEGGNITNGVGGIEGAICRVEYKNEKFVTKTINDKKPCGICGSGIIDAVAEMIKHKYIDETGLMRDEYFETGIDLGENIIITQKDIRNIQFAKSAIRAAIECLIKYAKIKYEAIERVYIGGGFGYYIDIKNCVEIGLIPKELEDKITAIGNCSLGGALKCIKKENEKSAENIARGTEELVLGKYEEFNDIFMKNMNFVK